MSKETRKDVIEKQVREGRGNLPTDAKKDVWEKFVEFCSLPGPDRAAMFEVPFDPKLRRYEKIPTQADFAAKYGVHQNTLVKWKKTKEFQELVDQKQARWGIDHTPDVMSALLRRCLQYGISSDVGLWLAFYKQWDRKQVIKHVHEKLDPDDIRSLIELLPETEKKQAYDHLTNIVIKAERARSSQED